jgi:DNA-binding PadR family transcriptional regulator
MMYAKRNKLLGQILNHIAKKGEAYQSEMDSDLGVTYRTLIRQLHFLKRLGLIRVVRTEPSSKKGKEKNIYGLTVKGLYTLLASNLGQIANMERIFENSPHLLLTFEKWHLFKKAGLTDKIFSYIRDAALSMAGYQGMVTVLGANARLKDDKVLRFQLDYSILYAPLFGENEPREKLAEIYKNDVDLSRFIAECFKVDEEEHNKYLRVKELWLNQT